MKKSIKTLCSLVIMAGALTACGSNTSAAASSSAKASDAASSETVTPVASSSEEAPAATAKMVASFDIATYNMIESMGWHIVDDYQLVTYSDSTYRLFVTEDMFGEIDGGYETKGHRVIITEGTYTATESADGTDGHMDYSLSASPIVYAYQHHKGYSRNSDIVGQSVMLDTSNWTEAMTNATSATYPNGASDILAKYGSAKKVTVEDPSTFTEDTTLAYQLVTVPEDDASGAAAPELSKFKTIKAAYDISSYSLVEAMGWYIYNNDFVVTFSDNTYFRDQHIDQNGQIDGGFECKGARDIITEGTYTITDTSTDGMDGHGDLSISASDRVYLNQHHKGWSRNTDVVGTPLVCDTDNWTEAMTNALTNGGKYADMAAFKAHYGSAAKAVVSDPTFYVEDTTLSYQIITDFE